MTSEAEHSVNRGMSSSVLARKYLDSGRFDEEEIDYKLRIGADLESSPRGSA